MKKFDEFVNEFQAIKSTDSPFIKLLKIKEPLIKILYKELGEMHPTGTSDITITDASTENDIKGIGKRDDYVDENGEYTHLIIGIRLFYGNSSFIKAFDSMVEYGEFLIKFENKIKSILNFEKVANYNDYYCYLVKIDDSLMNLVNSTNGIEKYNL